MRVCDQGKHTREASSIIPVRNNVFYRHELKGMVRDVSAHVKSRRYLLLLLDLLRVSVLVTV